MLSILPEWFVILLEANNHDYVSQESQNVSEVKANDASCAVINKNRGSLQVHDIIF